MDDLQRWRRWGHSRLNVDPDIAGDTFRGYRDTLATAITPDDIPHLANSLYSKNIISHDNLERAMMIEILPSYKKVHLLDAIEAKIRSNTRSALFTVLDILNSEPVFSEHAERLWKQVLQEQRAQSSKIKQDGRALLNKLIVRELEKDRIFTLGVEKTGKDMSIQELMKLDDDFAEYEDAEESAEKDDDEKDHNQESDDSPESKKTSLLSRMRKGVRKMFGAARDMTSSFIKEALSALNLDVKIFRKYKKRFDKHTNREQVRWWFEIWGDEGALKALDSKWEDVSLQNKWRLETCPVPPLQRC